MCHTRVACAFVCCDTTRPLIELKEHKIALQELKTRLEEWDAKQVIWRQLHEEVATAHERNTALEEECSIMKQALVNAENKPPTVITETVTVEKVRSCCV